MCGLVVIVILIGKIVMVLIDFGYIGLYILFYGVEVSIVKGVNFIG